ncbi:MFS transporter [Streptomyces mashuensis]|uniref:MFS transporter n=1 Tax=Streptomyces mashuensis TaxID=33904 RepID=A0A919EAE7_9ACTN|nr:MFS transporter [Streptomyces mashuensis]GHF28360.1 MFS transporter [Streptomyces mashuensis]
MATEGREGYEAREHGAVTAPSGPVAGSCTSPGAGAGARVSRAFVLRLGLGYLGLYSAVLSVALVTLALRIEDVDPQHKETSLAVAASLGALVALLANPLAGRLSDRSTSRWGRRRPWMVGGVAGGGLGLAVVALVPSVAAVTAGWCFAQLCFNATIAALAATVPEQVPPAQRGTVSGVVGFSQRLAVPLGMGAAAVFSAGAAGFLVPAAVAVAVVVLFAVPLHDRPGPAGRAPFSVREFLGSFWTDPRAHPDFGWVWLTRFLTYFASVAPVPYLPYFLTSRLGVGEGSVAAVVALLTVVNYGLSAVTSVLCGWLSDRAGRRKPFVTAASLLLAGGLALLATADALPQVYAAQALLGIGSGFYFAVDMALATEVLPSSDEVGKDLGVINSADVLPQSVGPALAPLLLGLGGGHNYPALYGFTLLVGLAGALTVTRIKAVA